MSTTRLRDAPRRTLHGSLPRSVRSHIVPSSSLVSAKSGRVRLVLDGSGSVLRTNPCRRNRRSVHGDLDPFPPHSFVAYDRRSNIGTLADVSGFIQWFKDNIDGYALPPDHGSAAAPLLSKEAVHSANSQALALPKSLHSTQSTTAVSSPYERSKLSLEYSRRVAELSNREEHLAQHEEDLAHRELIVALKELYRREQAVVHREERLARREQDIAAREAAVVDIPTKIFSTPGSSHSPASTVEDTHTFESHPSKLFEKALSSSLASASPSSPSSRSSATVYFDHTTQSKSVFDLPGHHHFQSASETTAVA